MLLVINLLIYKKLEIDKIWEFTERASEVKAQQTKTSVCLKPWDIFEYIAKTYVSN